MKKQGFPELDEAELGTDQGDLIPFLQVVQRTQGYITEESVAEIARRLKISENHIYGVASFYTQFRFTSPGRHQVKVCLGTACHVQGGQQLSKEIQKNLGLKSGETTLDGNIGYEEVACLGCCAQAAVVEIDGNIHARISTDQLNKKISQLGSKDQRITESQVEKGIP